MRESVALEVQQPRHDLGQVLARLVLGQPPPRLGHQREQLAPIGVGHDEAEAVGARVAEAVQQGHHVGVLRRAGEDGEGLDFADGPPAVGLDAERSEEGEGDALLGRLVWGGGGMKIQLRRGGWMA